MNCSDVQEKLDIYFDLPPDHPERRMVDEHVRECDICAEMMALWQESMNWLEAAERSPSSQEPAQRFPQSSFASQVMNRIYEHEPWRLPINERAFSDKMKRKMTAIMAFCLALLICSLFYIAVSDKEPFPQTENSVFGLHEAQLATGDSTDSRLHIDSAKKSAMISQIVEPLKLSPLQSNPDYLLVLSVLGIFSTLLIMNWLSRTNI